MSQNLVFDGLQISNWDRATLEEVRRGGVHGSQRNLRGLGGNV